MLIHDDAVIMLIHSRMFGVAVPFMWKGVGVIMNPQSSSVSSSPSSPSSLSSPSFVSAASFLLSSSRSSTSFGAMSTDCASPGRSSSFSSRLLGRSEPASCIIGGVPSSPSSASAEKMGGSAGSSSVPSVRRCMSFGGFGEAFSTTKTQKYVGTVRRPGSGASSSCATSPVDLGERRAGIVRVASYPTTKAALEANGKTMWDDVEYSNDGLDKLMCIDRELELHQNHLVNRWRSFMIIKQKYDAYEGGLEQFARGYEKFGFNRENGGIVYREWAPGARAAQLVGDFNRWDGSRHQMDKNKFGVWCIRIPDEDGRPAIRHGSRVKIRLLKPNGHWVDRISAWIKYATQEPGRLDATFDGVYWDPPPYERYVFKYPRPPQPSAPRIYEAHVGMSSPERTVASYRYFADNVLPRIKKNGYNTVQLMAVMEHAYYASFGYHVTNFFAVSSRSGTPEDLKYLIDKAHELGLRILMDVIHSHASKNVKDGLNGFDFGQVTDESYFHCRERGYHRQWDSRLFNYKNWEVQRFLLSNLRWWLEEYQFDGFRFDGVTSMLYVHHGLNRSFTGDYREYFSDMTDMDATVYLMLANDLIHRLYEEATTIAEDVSGMPTIGLPVPIGGVGFDYRLAMAIPDKWIDFMKNRRDENWSMKEITRTLTNRRYTEKCVAYAESHDQSMVGDKSFAFMLMDREMYTGMSDLMPASPAIERGIALHKMIHLISMALGGDGYLNFMGNEFGHPEWVDFPRAENNWSYDKCRRQFDLVDKDHLRYKYMNRFDQAMNRLDDVCRFLSSGHQIVSSACDKDKVIVFERGDLVFVFNFHPSKTYSDYKVGCERPGRYRIVLDSDAREMGGKGRLGHNVDHFTSPEGIPGRPETNFNNRPCSFLVLSPSRTCQAYQRAPELEDRKRYAEGRRRDRWQGHLGEYGNGLENGVAGGYLEEVFSEENYSEDDEEDQQRGRRWWDEVANEWTGLADLEENDEKDGTAADEEEEEEGAVDMVGTMDMTEMDESEEREAGRGETQVVGASIQKSPERGVESVNGGWRYGDDQSNWDEDGTMAGFVYPWSP